MYVIGVIVADTLTVASDAFVGQKHAQKSLPPQLFIGYISKIRYKILNLYTLQINPKGSEAGNKSDDSDKL